MVDYFNTENVINFIESNSAVDTKPKFAAKTRSVVAHLSKNANSSENRKTSLIAQQLQMNEALIKSGPLSLIKMGQISVKDYPSYLKGKKLKDKLPTTDFLPNPWALAMRVYYNTTLFQEFLQEYYSAFVRNGDRRVYDFWDVYGNEEIIILDEYNGNIYPMLYSMV